MGPANTWVSPVYSWWCLKHRRIELPKLPCHHSTSFGSRITKPSTVEKTLWVLHVVPFLPQSWFSRKWVPPNRIVSFHLWCIFHWTMMGETVSRAIFWGWRTWSKKTPAMKKQTRFLSRMKLKQSEGQEKCTFNQLARLRNVSAPLLWGDKCWLTKKWNTWLQKMKLCDIEGDIQDVLQWSNPFRMIYSWVNTSPFDLDGVEKERPVQRGRTSFKDIIVPTNSCLGSSRSQCMCRIGVIWYAWFMIDCCWVHRSELGSNFLVPMWMTFDKPLHR